MIDILAIAFNSLKALVRKKDFYVFCCLLTVLFGLLFSEEFFGMSDISRYIKDIGFSCLWLFTFIIAVTFSAKQVPEEINSKTIYPLLAKPVNRRRFLIGKLLGSVLASGSSFLVFYLMYLAVVFVKGEGVGLMLSFQQIILGLFFLLLVSSVSLLLSLYLTLSATVTLSFVFYFYANWYWDVIYSHVLSSEGLSSFIWSFVYYLLPHYEFYNLQLRIVHSWDPLPLWLLISVIVYTCIYSYLLNFLAYRKLKSKFL